MLNAVLSKETCAKCKFCCSFRRCSLWETPLFPEEVVQKHPTDVNGKLIKYENETKDGKVFGRLNLLSEYKTDDSEEEAPCSFLDPHKGCTLSQADKPFDCKIWPLRIMDKDGKLVIALTPTCPAINQLPQETMKQLVCEGLGQKIFDYAQEHPFIIKKYVEGFPILQEF